MSSYNKYNRSFLMQIPKKLLENVTTLGAIDFLDILWNHYIINKTFALTSKQIIEYSFRINNRRMVDNIIKQLRDINIIQCHSKGNYRRIEFKQDYSHLITPSECNIHFILPLPIFSDTDLTFEMIMLAEHFFSFINSGKQCFQLRETIKKLLGIKHNDHYSKCLQVLDKYFLRTYEKISGSEHIRLTIDKKFNLKDRTKYTDYYAAYLTYNHSSTLSMDPISQGYPQSTTSSGGLEAACTTPTVTGTEISIFTESMEPISQSYPQCAPSSGDISQSYPHISQSYPQCAPSSGDISQSYPQCAPSSGGLMPSCAPSSGGLMPSCAPSTVTGTETSNTEISICTEIPPLTCYTSNLTINGEKMDNLNKIVFNSRLEERFNKINSRIARINIDGLNLMNRKDVDNIIAAANAISLNKEDLEVALVWYSTYINAETRNATAYLSKIIKNKSIIDKIKEFKNNPRYSNNSTMREVSHPSHKLYVHSY